MSSLESQLKEAQEELSRIVESSPEVKLKRRIEKIKEKQHREAVKKVQGSIKGNKSAIAREIKTYEDIKNRMELMREAIKELDEEANASRIKQRDLGAISFQLTRELQELENPSLVREKKLDTSGIYEEGESVD